MMLSLLSNLPKSSYSIICEDIIHKAEVESHTNNRQPHHKMREKSRSISPSPLAPKRKYKSKSPFRNRDKSNQKTKLTQTPLQLQNLKDAHSSRSIENMTTCQLIVQRQNLQELKDLVMQTRAKELHYKELRRPRQASLV